MLKIRFFLLLLATFFGSHTYPEGFREDTLVLTVIGLTPIKHVGIGMEVYCFTPEGTITTSPVTKVEVVADDFIYFGLTVNNATVYANGQQLFYNPVNGAWIKLVELNPKKDHVLTRGETTTPIASREKIFPPLTPSVFLPDKMPMYKISVKDYENFFVTEECILVHNFAWVAVPILVTLAPYIKAAAVTVIAGLAAKVVGDQLEKAAEHFFRTDSGTTPIKPDSGKPGEKGSNKNTPPPGGNKSPKLPPDLSKIAEELDKRLKNYLDKNKPISFEDIRASSGPGYTKSHGTNLFDKLGTKPGDGLDYFHRMKFDKTFDIKTPYGPGKVGIRPDGTTVVYRPGSSKQPGRPEGWPTLEHQKARYDVDKIRLKP